MRIDPADPTMLVRVMLVLIAAGTAAPCLAQARALEVSPILTDVIAKADGATSVTIRNRGIAATTVQLRLNRWTLQDGQDSLGATTDTAVSPPFATIQPGATHVVRVVRLSRRPIVGEEPYRLLIDELPAPRQDQVAVALTVRHALPVFFRSPSARAASLAWSIAGPAHARELVVVNTGERRSRIASLQVRDGAGTVLDLGSGLAGYALGGGERRWRLPTGKALVLKDVSVRFVDEAGPQAAIVSLPPLPGA